MQEEVDQKTIALAVKTGKLTAQVLQAAIRKYLAARQKGTGKAHHGQQSLRQLKKDGSALSNIEITDANIGLFKPCAKKYDIDFNALNKGVAGFVPPSEEVVGIRAIADSDDHFILAAALSNLEHTLEPCRNMYNNVTPERFNRAAADSEVLFIEARHAPHDKADSH